MSINIIKDSGDLFLEILPLYKISPLTVWQNSLTCCLLRRTE